MIITHNLGVVARYADRVNIMYAGKIIERGTAQEIYSNPRHPYTVGLLDSVPRMDIWDERRRLRTIEGSPPSLLNLPTGCSFNPRCQFKTERCLQDVPELIGVGEGHTAACWEWERVQPAVQVGEKA
jgi:oligopeptide/dipeptide ABC transporter ATP-binding protein